MRIFGRLISVLLALALLALSLLIVVEILVAGLGQQPLVLPYDTWYQGALNSAWSDPALRGIFLLLVLVALVLLYLAMASRKPLALPLKRTPGGMEAEVTTKSLEGSLARAAQDVDGISGAKVRVAKTKAQVAASTTRGSAASLQDDVAAAVNQRLADLPLASAPSVAVNVKTRSS